MVLLTRFATNPKFVCVFVWNKSKSAVTLWITADLLWLVAEREGFEPPEV